jgi:hypothetical protein
MAAQMPVRHRDLYHTMSQSAFDSAVASLDARIPTLGRHQIILELARIVALVGDGHTNIAPTRDPRIGFRGYPIALYLFSDGLYVRAADSAHARLVGAREARRGGDAGALRSARMPCAARRETSWRRERWTPHSASRWRPQKGIWFLPGASWTG